MLWVGDLRATESRYKVSTEHWRSSFKTAAVTTDLSDCSDKNLKEKLATLEVGESCSMDDATAVVWAVPAHWGTRRTGLYFGCGRGSPHIKWTRRCKPSNEQCATI